MVESQEEIATRTLVDTLAEQAELERLLERTKPPRQDGGELHYLLATPFRYPPLPHGSRFGTRFEPSLFYASIHRSALLAETAYYRFVFASGPARPFGVPLSTQHTAFSVRYRTEQGLRLEAEPFEVFSDALTSPVSYEETQALGGVLRVAGVEAFTYKSARDPEGGSNVALFSPLSLADRAPRQQWAWSCETTAEQVTLRRQAAHDVVQFSLDTFLVGGRLPTPAV